MKYSQIKEREVILEKGREILGSHFKFFKKKVEELNIVPKTPAWDLICFKIYRILYFQKNKGKKSITRQQLEKWLNFWSEYSTEKEYNDLKYVIFSSYKQFLQDEETANKLLSILEYKKNKILLENWSLFLRFFFTLRSRIKPSLTKAEFSLLQAMIKYQITSTKELSKILNKDAGNITRTKKLLFDKGIIYEGISLNLKKTNFVLLLVIVYGFDELSSIHEKENFPKMFLRKSMTLNTSCKALLLYYSFPVSLLKEICRRISEFFDLSIKKKEITKYEILVLHREEQITTFDYSKYDYKNKNWNYSISEIAIALHNKSKTKNELKPRFEDTKESELKLTKPGLKILEYIIKNRDLTVSRIEKETNISQSTIRKYLKHFTNEQLYIKRVNVIPIFGTNDVMIIFKKKVDQKEIHDRLSLFPEVYSEPFTNLITDEKGLIVTFMYTKRVNLPTSRYDTTLQKWY